MADPENRIARIRGRGLHWNAARCRPKLPLDAVSVAGQANMKRLYQLGGALMGIMMPAEMLPPPDWLTKQLSAPGDAPHVRIRPESRTTSCSC